MEDTRSEGDESTMLREDARRSTGALSAIVSASIGAVYPVNTKQPSMSQGRS